MTVWARKGVGFEEEAEADREYWATLFTPDARVALIEDLCEESDRMNGRKSSTNRDYDEIVAALVKNEAPFVIVGAHAVAFHLKPRYTKHIDIFVDPAED